MTAPLTTKKESLLSPGYVPFDWLPEESRNEFAAKYAQPLSKEELAGVAYIRKELQGPEFHKIFAENNKIFPKEKCENPIANKLSDKIIARIYDSVSNRIRNLPKAQQRRVNFLHAVSRGIMAAESRRLSSQPEDEHCPKWNSVLHDALNAADHSLDTMESKGPHGEHDEHGSGHPHEGFLGHMEAIESIGIGVKDAAVGATALLGMALLSGADVIFGHAVAAHHAVGGTAIHAAGAAHGVMLDPSTLAALKAKVAGATVGTTGLGISGVQSVQVGNYTNSFYDDAEVTTHNRNAVRNQRNLPLLTSPHEHDAIMHGLGMTHDTGTHNRDLVEKSRDGLDQIEGP